MRTTAEHLDAVRDVFAGAKNPVDIPQVATVTGLSRSDAGLCVSRLYRMGELKFVDQTGWVSND